jgi:hypothetical protein
MKTTPPLTAQERVILFCTATGVRACGNKIVAVLCRQLISSQHELVP